MSGESEEADSPSGFGKKKSCRLNKKVLKTVSDVLKKAKGTAVLQVRYLHVLDRMQTLCLYYYMQADHVLAESQASKLQLRGESEEPGPSSMSGARVLGNSLKKAKVTVVLHVRFACICT